MVPGTNLKMTWALAALGLSVAAATKLMSGSQLESATIIQAQKSNLEGYYLVVEKDGSRDIRKLDEDRVTAAKGNGAKSMSSDQAFLELDAKFNKDLPELRKDLFRLAHLVKATLQDPQGHPEIAAGHAGYKFYRFEEVADDILAKKMKWGVRSPEADAIAKRLHDKLDDYRDQFDPLVKISRSPEVKEQAPENNTTAAAEKAAQATAQNESQTIVFRVPGR